jgi:hypothetical protein
MQPPGPKLPTTDMAAWYSGSAFSPLPLTPLGKTLSCRTKNPVRFHRELIGQFQESARFLNGYRWVGGHHSTETAPTVVSILAGVGAQRRVPLTNELGLNPANTTVQYLRFHNTLRHGREVLRCIRIEPEPARKYGRMTQNCISTQLGFAAPRKFCYQV